MAQTATKQKQASANQKASQEIDSATMQAFEAAQSFTIVKQVFKKGDAVTYQPVGAAQSVAQVKKALKSSAGKEASHVMAMPSGPVVPASALIDKNYTIKGVVANPQVRVAKSSGKPWVSFGLKREGKDTMSCVAFGTKVAELVEVANAAKGQAIKVFGYYKDQPNSDRQQFVLLKAIPVGQ